jgi:hypothetical protein
LWGESVESWTQLGFKQTGAKWHWNAFHHLLHTGVDLSTSSIKKRFPSQTGRLPPPNFNHFSSTNQPKHPTSPKKSSQQKTMPTISPTASPWHVGSQRIGAIKDMVLAEVTE